MKTVKKLLPAILYFVLGLLFLFWTHPMDMAVRIILGLFAILSSVTFFKSGFQYRRVVDFLTGIFLVTFGLFIFFADTHLTAIFYALYLGAIGVVFGIQWVLDHYSAMEGIPAFLYLAACIFFLVKPQDVNIVFGVYLILLGLQELFEEYYFSKSYNPRYWSIRHFISLPCFIVGVLPALIIRNLEDKAMKDIPTNFDARKSDKPVNFRVYIHTGDKGRTIYGHMTFSHDGVMYSYGDYDYPDEKFFKTIGPGILFTADADLYTNNCCVVENCPLFEFGLHLTDEQLKKFHELTEQMKKDTIPWECQLEKFPPAQQKEEFKKLEHLYADRLWYRIRCKFRMYTKGRWAWYSLLGCNCSNYDAAMLNEIGLDLPIQKSLVSPGEYYSIFNTEFKNPESNVITRSWHSVQDPRTLYTINGILGYSGIDSPAIPAKYLKEDQNIKKTDSSQKRPIQKQE